MADNLSLERIGRVTGSRIAGVLGISPYRTRKQVMREMVREYFWEESEFDGNFVTEWGSEHELDGVAEYELQNGITVVSKGDEQVTVVDPGGLFAVTPDGLILAHQGQVSTPGALEVKCPFRATYNSIWDREDYQQQCRLVALVLGVEWVDFAVWRVEATPVTRLWAGKDADGKKYDWLKSKVGNNADTVIGEVERFLAEYRAIIADEELAEHYRTGIEGVRSDIEWLTAVAAYLELEAEVARVTHAQAVVRGELEALADLAGSTTQKGGGLQVIARKPSAGGEGAIAYKKVAEDLAAKAGVELTPSYLASFRGKPSSGNNRITYAFKKYEDD